MDNSGDSDNEDQMQYRQTTLDQYKNKFGQKGPSAAELNRRQQQQQQAISSKFGATTSVNKSQFEEESKHSIHNSILSSNKFNQRNQMSFSSGDNNNNNGDNNNKKGRQQMNASFNKLAQKNKNFLLLNWPDYFPEEKQETFNAQDYRHLLVQTIYEAYDYPQFREVVEWGCERKGSNVQEVFMDYQKIKNMKVQAEQQGEEDKGLLFKVGRANEEESINEANEEEDASLNNNPIVVLQDVMKVLAQNADTILPAFCLALEHVRTHKLDVIQQQEENSQKRRRRIICRIYNLDNVTQFQDLKANLINHFICLRGIVLKTSSIRLLVTSMKFLCFDCKRVMVVHFANGMYCPPGKCVNPQCKGKTFCPDKTSASTILFQRIRVQELEDGDSVSGRVPRFIDCELKENLVGTIISGDNVLICGTLKTESSEGGKGLALAGGGGAGGAGGGANNKKTQGIYTHYLEINSIVNLKGDGNNSVIGRKAGNANNNKNNNQNGGGEMMMMPDDEENFISENDYKVIQRLSEQRDVFPLLVKSLCPAIYGHELLKAGLVLAILGGASVGEDEDESGQAQESCGGGGRKNPFNSEGQCTFRRDCHVLLIGDPGLGKSQMLKFVANVSPRSVYVCGNATSNAGLTVSVSKDQQTGESTLEAGALILSDQGVCCIDEFDKMQDQHYALLEAMEQQTVSLAKSGVLCSLQSRATIIASANPVGGHYNKAKNIKDNIKISNAILSRFDLIFLMLDKPDPNRDQKLSEHIMRRKYDDFESGMMQNYDQLQLFQGNLDFQQMQPNQQQQQQDVAYTSFTEKIIRECEKVDKNRILQPYLIRKYLTYAKNHVNPTLSVEAAEVIKGFYLTLRENNQTTSSIPITTRQLESLIRLAQARAKVELRQEVSKEDAQDVVDLMYESLFDSLEDMSYGGSKNQISLSKGIKQMDMNNVSGLSKPKQTKLFLDKLKEEGRSKQSFLFDYQELAKIAKGMNMNVGEFSTYIEELNFKNVLMHKGGKTYELLEKGLL